jgi:serpin B
MSLLNFRLMAHALVVVLCVACGDSNKESSDVVVARSDKQRVTPQVPPQDLATQVRASNAFAVDLYHKIRTSGQNLFASPHSISTALAMLYGGAAGVTEQQMAKALHFDLPQSKLHPVFNKLDQELGSRGQGAEGIDGKAFELSVANALWGRPDGKYLPTYLDLLAVNYGAGMNLVDFGGDPEAARQRINAWVAKQTHDRIKDLLKKGDIDTYTALVLTNAIYFNAAWAEPFEETATMPHPFDADGSSVTVQMMSGLKRDARYGKGAGYEAVELPFDGKELSMLLLVPDAGTFGAFQQGLTSQTIEGALAQLGAQEVYLKLPRFEFTSRRELKSALMDLGMVDAFNETRSDFAKICGAPPGSDAALVVRKVIHQAFVLVAEKGAEAAAATAVTMADGGAAGPGPEPVYLTVDRPFLLAIRDNATGVILFLGHVLDPNA